MVKSEIVRVINYMNFTGLNGTVCGISATYSILYRRGRLPPKIYRPCDHFTIRFRSDRSSGQIGGCEVTGTYHMSAQQNVEIIPIFSALKQHY